MQLIEVQHCNFVVAVSLSFLRCSGADLSPSLVRFSRANPSWAQIFESTFGNSRTLEIPTGLNTEARKQKQCCCFSLFFMPAESALSWNSQSLSPRCSLPARLHGTKNMFGEPSQHQKQTSLNQSRLYPCTFWNCSLLLFAFSVIFYVLNLSPFNTCKEAPTWPPHTPAERSTCQMSK